MAALYTFHGRFPVATSPYLLADATHPTWNNISAIASAVQPTYPQPTYPQPTPAKPLPPTYQQPSLPYGSPDSPSNPPQTLPPPRALPRSAEPSSPYPSPSDGGTQNYENRLRRPDLPEQLPPKRMTLPRDDRNESLLDDTEEMSPSADSVNPPPPLRRPRKSDKPLGNDYNPPEPMDETSLLDDEPIELTPPSKWPAPPSKDTDPESLLDDPMEPDPSLKSPSLDSDDTNLLDEPETPSSNPEQGISPVTIRSRANRSGSDSATAEVIRYQKDLARQIEHSVGSKKHLSKKKPSDMRASGSDKSKPRCAKKCDAMPMNDDASTKRNAT